MIQRIQSVYLFLALVACVACLCMPIASIESAVMGAWDTMYNLWMVDEKGQKAFVVWPLFAILLLTCPISLFTIFMYNNRKMQARMCVFNIFLLLGWYAVYAAYVLTFPKEGDTTTILLAACFPLIAIVLLFMARRGILHDEALVRAADRIR